MALEIANHSSRFGSTGSDGRFEFDDLSLGDYRLTVTDPVGSGVAFIAATLAGMRAGAIPSWAGWLGVIAGILALGSIIFLPQAAIGLWILIVSGGMFIRGMRTGGTGAPAAPA